MAITSLQPVLEDFFNKLGCPVPSGVAPTISYPIALPFTEGVAVNYCPDVLTGDLPITVTISPALPAGLSIDSTTGCISGTPTVPSPSTSYTVTATNAFGNGNNVISIQVDGAGKITLTGGIADGLYTDLAFAIAYIQIFTSATITDTSLVGDVFKFTVPANTTFGNNFLINSTATSFVDNLGLISVFGSNTMQSSTTNSTLGNSEFGESSFAGSFGNHNLGNCVFAPSNFDSASGVNTINNILLASGTDFATNYLGTMNILGNIGTTEGNDYPNFFNAGGSATINALAIKVASNGGVPEGDLDLAQTNGVQVNYVL